MNKKVLGVAVTLLLAAMFVAPAMAAPATKIEGVTMVVSPGGPVPYDGYPRWVSDGTISHSRGTNPPGMTVTITIPNPQDPENPTVLSGDYYSDWVANANWKKDPVEVVIMSKLTLTFGDDTFEGVVQRTITGNPFLPTSPVEDHIVLRGTGAFQGQTLKLSCAGIPAEGPMVAEGYIIMPK